MTSPSPRNQVGFLPPPTKLSEHNCAHPPTCEPKLAQFLQPDNPWVRQWENVIHCLHSCCPSCGISADQQIVSICTQGSEFCLLRKYPVACPCDLSKAGSISEGSKVKAAEKRVIFWVFLGARCGFLTSFLKCVSCPTRYLQLTKAGCCAMLRTIHSKRRFYSESEKEFACNAVGGMQKGIYERNLN